MYVYILFCAPFSFSVVRLAFCSKGDFMRMDVKNSLSYFIHSAILPLTIFFHLQPYTHWEFNTLSWNIVHFGWSAGWFIRMLSLRCCTMITRSMLTSAYFTRIAETPIWGHLLCKGSNFLCCIHMGFRTNAHTKEKMMRAKKCEKYIWIVTIGTNILFISAHNLLIFHLRNSSIRFPPILYSMKFYRDFLLYRRNAYATQGMHAYIFVCSLFVSAIIFALVAHNNHSTFLHLI